MSTDLSLRAIPVDDRAWLLAALRDALAGGAPVFPVAADVPDASVSRLLRSELPAGTSLVLHTSGSSGVPKAVALSSAALYTAAHASHEALGGPGSWTISLPINAISGLQMLVRCLVAGYDPVFLDGSFDVVSFLAASEAHTGERRYASLVPVQLTRVLDYVDAHPDAAEQLARYDAILVGGQHTSLELRRRAHQHGVALFRSYGMTETAGGCVYDGVETGDTRVRIRAGEVQLSGDTLALGYVGDPELTADRFITENGVRWYRTGDAGELLGGMLTVTGRRDRVFVSGGVNVSLDEIERVVHENAGWQHTIACTIDDTEWGQRAVLVSEAQPHHIAFTAVQSHVRNALGPAAVPVSSIHVDQIPRLPNGKPDARAAAQIAQQQHHEGTRA